MAGTVINLTNGPLRFTNTGTLGSSRQYARDAVDILDARQIDVAVMVVGLEGSSPGVVVDFWTSMSNTQDDLSSAGGWSQVSGLSVTANTASVTVHTATSGLLRYLRWTVSTLTGTAVTAQISAIARS